MKLLFKIQLPIPPPELSPNARIHWAKKAMITRKYRATVKMLALARLRTLYYGKVEGVAIKVEYTFRYPDKRRRDVDNLIARMKSGLDGIVDAGVMVDDSKIGIKGNPIGHDPIVKTPCVIVELWGEE